VDTLIPRVLKVREWLKFKKPDYEGFVEHVRIWDEEGISYGRIELIRLANNYGTPISYMRNGEIILDKHEDDKNNT
jgi:hypothetical protein